MKPNPSVLLLGITLFCYTGIASADSRNVVRSDEGSVTTISEPTGKGEPNPAECRDILDSWKQYVRDPNAGLSDQVEASIATVLEGDLPCEEKVGNIENILNAYWATEPWCQSDRERFKKLYTPKVASSIPAEGQSTVEALLAQGALTCSETLAAAVTIVRLSNPDFSLYDSASVPLGDPSAISSDSIDPIRSEIATRAKAKTSKRKLVTCRAKVKRLQERASSARR